MENRKGSGIFLGVVGVATLVVAIIGATFAYFSASATTNNGDIGGNTLDTKGEALSIAAVKYEFAGATAANNNLVPTNITTSNYGSALTNNCEATPNADSNTPYTGCHVFTITATNATDGQYNLDLALELASVTVKADWKYIVYTSTAANVAGDEVDSGEFDTDGKATVAIDDGTETLEAGTHVYYLMVYLQDDNGVQNDGAANDATGSYTGTVTFAAVGGGRVSATFSA